MEQGQFSVGHIKNIVASVLPEVIEQYWKEREKELYQISVIERIIRVEEEELRALKVDVNKRIDAVLAEQRVLREEMKAQARENYARIEARTIETNTRLETLLREMNAKFEAVLAEQRALREEFKAQARENNAKYEAVFAGLRTLKEEFKAQVQTVSVEQKALREEMGAHARGTGARIESLQREIKAWFDGQKINFSILGKSIEFVQWLIVFAIIFICFVITLVLYLKH